VAIDNARLYEAVSAQAEALSEKNKHLSFLQRQVAVALTSSLSLNDVLNQTMSHGISVSGAKATCVAFYDEPSGRFKEWLTQGLSDHFVGNMAFRPGGLADETFASRTYVLSNDRPETKHKLSRLAHEEGIQAFICLPLIGHERELGVIYFYRDDRDTFTPDEIELLTTFAHLAAGAIDNSRLYEEAETQRIRLTHIFDSANDAIISADSDGRIIAWNKGAQAIFGWSAEEAWCEPLTLLIPERYREAHQRGLERVRSGGEPRVIGTAVELHGLRKDGGEFPLELSLTGWKTREGTFYTAIIRDITERKRMEQMKSDFVSFATHQLRTPLAGIKWLLELAAQGPEVPEETRSYIQDTRDSAERLIELVNNLLDISRIENGKLAVALQETDLHEMTRSVLDEVKTLVEEKGHQLSFAGDGEVPPVWADPQLLRQVVLNLVSNAIKYTPPGGKMEVWIEREDSSVLWAIRDNGIGISKEAQGRLFEKFFRADNALAIETEGTGLGLYLARLIVERLGGRIWCESEEGEGATFLLKLPLSE
jgi:PAS domain S-box-containing protein